MKIITFIQMFMMLFVGNEINCTSIKSLANMDLEIISFQLCPLKYKSNKTIIENILSITGLASSSIETDLIILTLRVESFNKTLNEAYRTNIGISNEVSEIYQKLNIPDKNITTKRYSSEEKYTEHIIGTSIGPKRINRTFEGYTIVNEMEIIMSDVRIVSDLIEQTMLTGFVLITDLKFVYSRLLKKILEKELLTISVKDALQRAHLTANILNTKIIDVKKVDFIGYRPPIPIYMNGLYGRSASSRRSKQMSKPIIFSKKTNVEIKSYIEFIIEKK